MNGTSQPSTTAIGNLQEVGWTDLDTYSTAVRGSLTVIDSGHRIPFSINRIFYIYGATKGSERGAHAHRETWQAFIAIKGKFSLELTDGHESTTYVLGEPNRALYVPPMIWARLYDFTCDAVCLVLASTIYDPADYVREWDDYLALMKNGSDRLS
jgi:dTDP-4-dehydrorhamnose 3,5-epimerase-like enzyme